jgi:hypothetical protein
VWLEDLAKARAKTEEEQQNGQDDEKAQSNHWNFWDSHTSAQIQALKTEETTKRFFGRIKHAIGKDQLAGLTMVIAPDQFDNQGNVTRWRECRGRFS